MRQATGRRCAPSPSLWMAHLRASSVGWRSFRADCSGRISVRWFHGVNPGQRRRASPARRDLEQVAAAVLDARRGREYEESGSSRKSAAARRSVAVARVPSQRRRAGPVWEFSRRASPEAAIAPWTCLIGWARVSSGRASPAMGSTSRAAARSDSEWTCRCGPCVQGRCRKAWHWRLDALRQRVLAPTLASAAPVWQLVGSCGSTGCDHRDLMRGRRSFSARRSGCWKAPWWLT